MSEEKQDVFDPNSFDFGAVETQADFNANAKDGVYPLVLKKIEVGAGELNYEPNDRDTRVRAKLFYTFANPSEVEKVGDGMLKGINETLWLHTAGSIKRLRAMVESHGADWGAFAEGLKQGREAGTDFASVVTELLTQFVETQATARVAYVTSYKDKSGEIHQLKSPKNNILGFVAPAKKTA